MDNFEKFYNYSLRFLSFRPRSEQEVKENLKLKTKNLKLRTGREIDQSTIELVIKKLKEKRFINDVEFAKWWIEQRIKFKPRSFKLIKLELKQKGIPNEIVDFVISNFQFPISSDKELAKALIEKKIQKYKHLSKNEVYQKLGSALFRKGFSYEVIKTSIDEALEKGV